MKEISKTEKWLLGGIAIELIIGIVIIAFVYSTYVESISTSELNLEVLAILSSILIPITFLIFIEITRDESWRNFKYNKRISVVIVLLLFAALYLVFTATSIGIINKTTNITNAVKLLYYSLSLCAIILTTLLTIYVYIY